MVIHKRSLILIFTAFFLSFTLSSSAFADDKTSNKDQKDSPEWLVRMFFLNDTFPEKSDYITGEVKEHQSDYPTMGEYISKSEEIIV